MIRLRHFAVTAALAVLAACDGHTDRLMAPEINPDIIISVNGNTKVIKTPNVQNSNWGFALIAASGGSITVDGHTLSVPAGAVKHSTWFMLKVVGSNAVHVELKAWRASDGQAVTQFTNVPVQLTLNARSLGTLDPSLLIVYLRDDAYDGRREPVPSKVDTIAGTVTGYLTHFSAYALARREFSPGID
jgi:hypothetical protein